MLGDTYNVVDLVLGRRTVKHKAWKCFALAVNMVGQKDRTVTIIDKKTRKKKAAISRTAAVYC